MNMQIQQKTTRNKESKRGKGKPAGDKKANKKPTLADQADKYRLYQKSVQTPKIDARFFAKTFAKLRGRDAKILREDFCGTSLLSTTWVKGGSDRKAIAIDLDPEPLNWAREHNVAKLAPEERERIELIEGNALEGVGPKADIVCAMNFSYNCFTKRKELMRYFEVAKQKLVPDGLFICELFGGTESMTDVDVDEDGGCEVRDMGKFKYIWRQHAFNPITHELNCSISFKFPDKSRLEPAFTYAWRLWTLPEVRDMLEEVGFSKVQVYWEQMDDDGEGTGVFKATEREENQESWLVYIVAEP